MIWQAPTTKYGKDDEDTLFWVVLQDKNSGGDNMLQFWRFKVDMKTFRNDGSALIGDLTKIVAE